MLDAVALEERGIPVVTFVTESFSYAAGVQARMRGMPQLEFAVVPHRYNWETPEEKAQAVDNAFPKIETGLIRPASASAR